MFPLLTAPDRFGALRHLLEHGWHLAAHSSAGAAHEEPAFDTALPDGPRQEEQVFISEPVSRGPAAQRRLRRLFLARTAAKLHHVSLETLGRADNVNAAFQRLDLAHDVALEATHISRRAEFRRCLTDRRECPNALRDDDLGMAQCVELLDDLGDPFDLETEHLSARHQNVVLAWYWRWRSAMMFCASREAPRISPRSLRLVVERGVSRRSRAVRWHVARTMAPGTAGPAKTSVTSTARCCFGQTESTELVGTISRSVQGRASDPWPASWGLAQKSVLIVSVSPVSVTS